MINKVKALNRVAYGYRNFTNYKAEYCYTLNLNQ
ncbi:transposase [Paraliobacillus salinarum]